MLTKSTLLNTKEKQFIIERLTALWALNECGLGGFMHAFSSPFTGIIVGGISVLLITLIASHSKTIFRTLSKALIIVLLIKLSVSPHSPITAYIAVSFQAFLGILLYRFFSVNTITILLVSTISFMESALQKLFTLTILYGQSLWDALHIYTTWVTNKLSFLEFIVSSKTILLTYIGFYSFSGMITGFIILRIIKLMSLEKEQNKKSFHLEVEEVTPEKRFSKKPLKLIYFWVITLTIILIPLVFFNNTNGWKIGIYLLARSFLILILWYKVLGPLLLKGLNKMLLRKNLSYQKDIQNTLNLLPFLKQLIKQAWQDSKSFKGLNRMQHFLAKSIIYCIHFNPTNK